MNIFHHLNHLSLECWVGFKIDKCSDQFLACLLTKLEFAVVCRESLIDFFELLHHLLSTEDFKSNIVVLNFEIQLVALLFSIDNLSNLVIIGSK